VKVPVGQGLASHPYRVLCVRFSVATSHAESDISNGDDFFEEFYRRALKSLSTSEIEAMIAKVLSDAAGREYKAEIKRLDFIPFEGASMNDATEITILIQRSKT